MPYLRAKVRSETEPAAKPPAKTYGWSMYGHMFSEYDSTKTWGNGNASPLTLAFRFHLGELKTGFPGMDEKHPFFALYLSIR